MFYKYINVPVFIEIGKNILNDVDYILRSNNLYFEKPLIITGETSSKIISKYSFYKDYETYQLKVGQNLIGLRRKIIEEKFDIIFACGGGRIIDVGKLISKETLVPLISIPTLLSNDGISSPISVIRFNNSYKSVGTVMPIGVIIDIEIIRESPSQFLLAGVGDLLSNISASYDWYLAYKRKKEKMDNFSRMLAYLPAIGILNKANTYSSLRDTEFIKDLGYGLVLSGISMGIARSSRPASGSEHNISHALDMILKNKKKPHGLQVGFATLLTTFLQRQYKEYRKISEFYEDFGFPKTFTELGIEKDVFIKAVELAPTIRERYTILNEYTIEDILRIIKDNELYAT